MKLPPAGRVPAPVTSGDYTTPDQYGRATPGCWSVCAVADIVGKPEGIPRVKKCLTLETNIDTVLAEKVLQLELSTPHSVSIPAG